MASAQRFTTVLLVLFGVCTGPFLYAQSTDDTTITVEAVELLNDEDLRELVSPVALYPDDLLAIVLPASTYPLQIVAAARYRAAAESDTSLEPDENWDESVVALLNYPEALDFLNNDLNWTWELGQAVLAQQEDVLKAVSAFREEAQTAGNLASDERQVVAVEDDVVTITPADPEVIYVPYYDPYEVTVYQPRRVYYYYPTAYPVYYYPYSYGHHFYDYYGFWGVSSIFALSWSHYYVNHYYHYDSYHPYYGHNYHRNHFRRTRHYNSPRAHHRRSAHRRNEHHETYNSAGWRPNNRYAGARPNYAQNRQYTEQTGTRHTRRQTAQPAPYTSFVDQNGAVRIRPEDSVKAQRRSTRQAATQGSPSNARKGRVRSNSKNQTPVAIRPTRSSNQQRQKTRRVRPEQIKRTLAQNTRTQRQGRAADRREDSQRQSLRQRTKPQKTQRQNSTRRTVASRQSSRQAGQTQRQGRQQTAVKRTPTPRATPQVARRSAPKKAAPRAVQIAQRSTPARQQSRAPRQTKERQQSAPRQNNRAQQQRSSKQGHAGSRSSQQRSTRSARHR
jgi:hypothetical protein